MFDTIKFGGYLSTLRKNADMTQSELSEKLNLTRQAVSNYERGDSFPDISVLVKIAEVFGISLEQLINSGEPTKAEAALLANIALGSDVEGKTDLSVITNLAPLLKPSLLEKLSQNLSHDGIDISNVVSLAEYLNSEAVVNLLSKSDNIKIDETMLEKLMPFIDETSKGHIFEGILEGRYDYRLIKFMLPYYMDSLIENAVIEGALPWEAMDILHEYVLIRENLRKSWV